MNSHDLEEHLLNDDPEAQALFFALDVLEKGYIGPEDYFITMTGTGTALIYVALDDGLFLMLGRADGVIFATLDETRPHLPSRYLQAPDPAIIAETLEHLREAKRHAWKLGSPLKIKQVEVNAARAERLFALPLGEPTWGLPDVPEVGENGQPKTLLTHEETVVTVVDDDAEAPAPTDP